MLTRQSAVLAQQPMTVLAKLSEQSFVSGTADGVVQVWNVVNDETTAMATYKNLAINVPIKFLQVLSEKTKKWVVIGYASGIIEILDVTSKVPVSLRCLSDAVDLIALLLLPDNRLIAGYASGSIKLWDLNLINLGRGVWLNPFEYRLCQEARTLAKIAVVDHYLAAADSSNEIHVWKISVNNETGTKLSGFEEILTVQASSEITGLALLSRSNLHVLSSSIDGKMRHWKVREKFIGGFSATLDATSDVVSGSCLVSVTDLPQWVTVSPHQVQQWKLPMKFTPHSSPSAEPKKHSSWQWIQRQAADAVERATDSVPGERVTFDGETVHACIFLSENLFVIAAGTGQCYLWRPVNSLSRAPIISEMFVAPSSIPRVTVSDKIQDLGSGSFGIVYKANLMPENKIPVAVKRVSIFSEEALKREIILHIQFSHPNILSLYGIFYTEVQCFLVCELMEGGTLHSLLYENKIALSFERCCELVQDMVAAVLYLHTLGIVHRDIKSENMLLNRFGRLKLSDFGATRVWGGQPIGPQDLEGTLPYLAPELVALQLNGDAKISTLKETDIYALAIVFWEMVTRKGLPYQLNVTDIAPNNALSKSKAEESAKIWRDTTEKLNKIDVDIAKLKEQAPLSEQQEQQLEKLQLSRQESLTDQKYWYKAYVEYFVLSGQRETIPRNAPLLFRRLIEEGWAQEPAKRPTIEAIDLRLKQQMMMFQPVDAAPRAENQKLVR